MLMSRNKTNMYDIEPHIAEIYDLQETYGDDVELVRKLIGGRGPLRILEPFCGTGRIVIPLAFDGHEVVGLDQAKGMLDRARRKVGQLPEQVQRRISLYKADVTADEWPVDLDLVVLGGNCLYELATPEEQENCIASAATSLHSGGHVYIDNDHMEGELDESWHHSGVKQGFPTGVCSDGTRVESTTETIWSDVPRRLARFRRCTKVTLPDGSVIENEYVQQKHPVSKTEVQQWLGKNGFTLKQVYGDRTGNPYNEESPRAIFWAKKK
jgi:SAM-dependent methyltransferase